MPVTLKQFAKSLTASGVMSASDLGAFAGRLDPQPTDAQGLAKELVRARKLTKFQATQVYRGKGKSLAFGEYVVLDKIGQGGMGEVYKAQHRRMKRVVAIKVLPPKAVDSPDAIKRFEREVEAAAKLEHQNVVTAYDAGEANGNHFLVMQYVDGNDLAVLVKKNGPLSVDQAVHYIIQAAKGLEYAHGEGVVHRDIKPSNLLVDKKGTVKILDMGLARIDGAADNFDQSQDRDLTQAGQIMGTVDYMAPEQAEDTRSADHRADIYSLGCTLYRLLVGKSIYGTDTAIKTILAHREAKIPSLCDMRDDVSVELDSVYRRMLAKKPEDRYQSMSDVVAELENFKSDRTVSGSSAPSVQQSASEDSQLDQFLQGLSDQTAAQSAPVVNPVATSQSQTEADIEKTLALDGTSQDTDPETLTGLSRASVPAQHHRKPRTTSRWWKDRRLQIGAVAGGVLLLLIVVIFSNLPNQEEETKPHKPKTPDSTLSPTEILTSPDWEWTEPVNLGPLVNSDTIENDPFLSADGLTLLFGSQKAIWKSTRASTDQSFGVPVKLGSAVNRSTGYQYGPFLLADGLTLVFISHRFKNGSGYSDLWMSTRSSTDQPFNEPVNLGPEINSKDIEAEPYLSNDALTIMFGRRPTGDGGKFDIWTSTRNSTSEQFGKPENLGPIINGEGDEADNNSPHLSADGRTLLFSSWRPGTRRYDIFMSTRPAKDKPFASPVRLGAPINSDEGEWSPFLSADGRTLIFSSDRPGGQGTLDLWMSRRVPKSLKTSTDPDRAVAEWVLGIGGTVETDADKEKEIKTIEELPPGTFQLTTINLARNNQVTNNSLEHLQGLTNLSNLNLTKTKVTVQGIADIQKALPKCEITGP